MNRRQLIQQLSMLPFIVLAPTSNNVERSSRIDDEAYKNGLKWVRLALRKKAGVCPVCKSYFCLRNLPGFQTASCCTVYCVMPKDL